MIVITIKGKREYIIKVIGLSWVDVAGGSVTAADIHKTDNTESADIIREGMLDDTTIELVRGVDRVKAESISRTL